MDVSAQPRVVRQIPANVVRVFIDYDRVTIPEPVIAVGKVKRGDIEIEAVEPETLPVPPAQMVDMSMAKAAGKASMFKGMFNAKAFIFRAGIMTDPLIVPVNVRSIGMAGPVHKTVILFDRSLVRSVIRLGMFLACNRRGTMGRDISASRRVILAVRLAPSRLTKGDNARNQKNCPKCDRTLHKVPPLSALHVKVLRETSK
jgi:hypothetical protein